jgi:hypothetical protein
VATDILQLLFEVIPTLVLRMATLEAILMAVTQEATQSEAAADTILMARLKQS